jgi:glycosyltransferase involved in cell wall biosynthesis
MKAVFAVCVRNVERQLSLVLANIERLATIYDDAAFVFVENDSNDNTRRLLQGWCAARSNARLISEDGVVHRLPPRTVRIAWARNECLSRIKSTFAEFNHMIVADGDEVNAAPINLEGFKRAAAFLEASPNRAAVFANQIGVYYDLWALRHKRLCPKDIWEETFDAARRNGLSDQEAYQRVFAPKLFSFNPGDPPVRVESAFGGLGIYKIKSVLENTHAYEGYKIKSIKTAGKIAHIGWQRCEHVSFHEGFAKRGQTLFIVPSFINAKTGSILNFNPSSHRFLMFDPSTFAPLTFTSV